MENEVASCPICDDESRLLTTSDRGERIDYDCPRCGVFRITRTASRMLVGSSDLHKISAWIREKKEYDRELPEIDSDFVRKGKDQLPDYDPMEKQLILMQVLKRKTKYPGDRVDIVSVFDYPICWSSGMEEFGFYLDALQERGLLAFYDGKDESKMERKKMTHDLSSFEVEITAKGWEYLDAHQGADKHRRQAFVAMWFDESMDDAWEKGIKPAIEKAGYRPCRIDKERFAERIDVRMIAEIKKSRFMIADVTGHRENVYYEAGYAGGINIPVIWTVRENDLDNVKFDTRQFQHVAWKKEDELREQVYNMIIAIVGAYKGEAHKDSDTENESEHENRH